MGTTFKVAIGTFIGIVLAYGAYRAVRYIGSSVKHQRDDEAVEWMGDITPASLVRACGTPARDVVSDFGADFPEVYRELYYRGGLPDITWCFRFTKFEHDTDRLGWAIECFYRGPAPSELGSISTVNVGGELDPDEHPELFGTVRPGDMGPGQRDRMIGAMPCLSRIE
ncbi:MAG: hypothetical protein ACRD2B_09385 [Terriglobia bacterium]